MSQALPATDIPALRLFTSALAAALTDPRRAAAVSRDQRQILRESWYALAESHAHSRSADLGLGELPPSDVDVEPLCRWLAFESVERETAHQRAFGLLVSQQCPPYETEYCHWKDPTYRAHQLADIAGFYRAFGLEPDSGHPERHDHVSLELEFVAFLLLKLEYAAAQDPSHASTCREALGAFVRDHVAWWMPTFGRCMERRIEQLVADQESDRQALDALAGVTQVMRAWVAVARSISGVEPCRRIIAPQVDSQPIGDECAACPSC